MQTSWNENRITLHGRVLNNPAVSHMNHGETYYVAGVAACRLSGAEDIVNVVLSETLLKQRKIQEGDEVSVWGEVRSFNNRSGTGSRLVITVFARDIHSEQAEDENHVILAGSLCKVPVCRRTPLGRDICDMMLAVNRRCGRTDYLPCIAWGNLAHRCGELDVGDAVALEGRLQSRTYIKRVGEEKQERTAFEVSITSIDVLNPK